MAKNAIGLAQATEDYGASFLLMVRLRVVCLNTLARLRIRRVRESWQSTFGGARNGNKPSLKRSWLLVRSRRFYVKFNFEGLLRGKYKSRMDGYTVVRQNGWMSANDIRELETSTVSVNKLAGICIWLMATCFRSALLVHMPVPNQQSPNR